MYQNSYHLELNINTMNYWLLGEEQFKVFFNNDLDLISSLDPQIQASYLNQHFAYNAITGTDNETFLHRIVRNGDIETLERLTQFPIQHEFCLKQNAKGTFDEISPIYYSIFATDPEFIAANNFVLLKLLFEKFPSLLHPHTIIAKIYSSCNIHEYSIYHVSHSQLQEYIDSYLFLIFLDEVKKSCQEYLENKETGNLEIKWPTILSFSIFFPIVINYLKYRLSRDYLTYTTPNGSSFILGPPLAKQFALDTLEKYQFIKENCALHPSTFYMFYTDCPFVSMPSMTRTTTVSNSYMDLWPNFVNDEVRGAMPSRTSDEKNDTEPFNEWKKRKAHEQNAHHRPNISIKFTNTEKKLSEDTNNDSLGETNRSNYSPYNTLK